MNPQNEKSILSFWHKLEFFTPFDAKIQDGENTANTTYTLDQLSGLTVGGQENQSIIHHHLQGKPEFCNRYPVRSKIYFNLFNSGCLSKSIQDLLQEQLSENEQYTQEAMSADKAKRVTPYYQSTTKASSTLQK